MASEPAEPDRADPDPEATLKIRALKAGIRWDEISRIPADELGRLLAADHRLRMRERHEHLEDLARVNGIEWGKTLKGQTPKDKPKWWLADDPFRAYLDWLHDQYEPPTEAYRQRQQRAAEDAFMAALIGRRAQA